MLVLSRQRDESIIIGDNIVITVVDIRGDKVRLGIDDQYVTYLDAGRVAQEEGAAAAEEGATAVAWRA